MDQGSFEMREIGGYIELDTYRLPMLHEGAIALDCGRNALAYLIKAKGIKKIKVPYFLCDSVFNTCDKYGAKRSFYHIGRDFRPLEKIQLEEGEWLYLVNYYGQMSNDEIKTYVDKYERVIVDNAQSYFQDPVPGVDTIYTSRKYFGVADGAFLYTDKLLSEDLPLDESFDRMNFLLGRYERTANEFYKEYTVNNKYFADQPIKRMSTLTNNLLHGIDYGFAKKRRIENFKFLDSALSDLNMLSIETGDFMYPFMIENGKEVRKKLQEQKIYIPVLWPTVFEVASKDDTEYEMAEKILPLPIDQRYDIDDMKYMLDILMKEIN